MKNSPNILTFVLRTPRAQKHTHTFIIGTVRRTTTLCALALYCFSVQITWTSDCLDLKLSL
jgi:hypothetical protein